MSLLNFVKQYSVQVTLNLAFARMTKGIGNGTSEDLVIAKLDFPNPYEFPIPDPYITGESILLLDDWSLSFVTCSSLSHDHVDYWGYLKPFKASVWYSLLASCLVVTLLLICQNFSKYKMILTWSELGFMILKAGQDVFLAAFEGTGPTLRVMFKSSASEKMIVVWGLMTFVLANTYKSIVTEDTTEPFVSNPPRKFDELANGQFQIYSSPIVAYHKSFAVPVTLTKYRVGVSEFDAEIYTLFMTWYDSFTSDLGRVILILLNQYGCQTMADATPWYYTPILSLIRPSENHANQATRFRQEFAKSLVGRIAGISQVTNASSVSTIVGKCEKTAFVAPSVYIKSNRFLLSIFGGKSSHLNRKPYVESIDTVFSRRVYMRVSRMSVLSERLKGKIQKLIEAGFYKFWESLIIHAHTAGGIGRLGDDKFVAQQLESNIITVFVMIGIAGGVCVVIFFIEFGLGRKTTILGGFRTLWSASRTCVKYLGKRCFNRDRVKPACGIQQE